MNSVQFALAVAAAAGGISGLAVAIISRRKVAAEAEMTLVAAAKDVVLIQRSELERLNAALIAIRVELAEANARAWKAEAQAAELMRRVKHLEELQEESREKRFIDIENRVTAEEARNTNIEEVARTAKEQADKDREAR